jgi:hypothetical protein
MHQQREFQMNARSQTVERAKKPYEAPVLEEREDLLQVTEGIFAAAISEGPRANLV